MLTLPSLDLVFSSKRADADIVDDKEAEFNTNIPDFDRTDKKGEANLSEESTTFGTSFEINIAGKKKCIQWAPADMPVIPIMTNMKAIKKETLLKVFLAPREK